MMHLDDIRAYCLSLPDVTEDQPFGDDNITFRVEGKIFLCLWLGDERLVAEQRELHFALKLLPERNEELRRTYEAVTPAWHWNKKHWSDVFFERLEPSLVESLIRESHTLIVSLLPKRLRQAFQAES